MRIDADLNYSELDQALRDLGGLKPGQTGYLVAGEDNRETATACGREFGLRVVLVSPEILWNRFCWAVVVQQGGFFSAPAP